MVLYMVQCGNDGVFRRFPLCFGVLRESECEYEIRHKGVILLRTLCEIPELC